MALGKKCGSLKSRRGAAKKAGGEVDLGLGLGLGYYTRGFGRKRIAVLKIDDASASASCSSSDSDSDSNLRTPSKKRCGVEEDSGNETSALESLPQDVLVKIVCGVDHDDLEQLAHVSRAIREASWEAKKCHFAYSTPKKTLRGCIDYEDEDDCSKCDDVKTPEAPRRIRARGVGRSLVDDEKWPRKELFGDMNMMEI